MGVSIGMKGNADHATDGICILGGCSGEEHERYLSSYCASRGLLLHEMTL